MGYFEIDVSDFNPAKKVMWQQEQKWHCHKEI